MKLNLAGVGLIVLMLGGCASSGRGVDDTVDITDRFVAYEADVQGKFYELGECIVEKDHNAGFLSTYKTRGSLRTLRRYDIYTPFLNRNKGISGIIIRLKKIDHDHTHVFVTPPYFPSKNEFVDVSGLIDHITKCANGNVQNATSYSDNRKRYPRVQDDVSREELISGFRALASVKLPEYDAKGDIVDRAMMKKARSRVRLSTDTDTLFIESALAGELKPLDRFYTDEVFTPNLSVANGVYGNSFYGVLFERVAKAFSDQLNPKHFNLVCFVYGYWTGVFSDPKATDERGVVLIRDRQILDGVIVKENDPFYKACLAGKEIHS